MFAKWAILALAAALAVVGGGSAAYVVQERAKEQKLANLNQTLTTSLVDMQHQVESLNKRMADLNEPKPASAAPPAQPKPKRAVRAAATRPAPPREDPRINELRAQLAEQQKQLAGTREDLGKAKDELSGRLDSTREELSTSIAKNHDEVVELQRRGERNIVEFQIDKSKQFQRVGPVRLSLRKADVKHRNFNVSMLVDDNEVQKKNVNLYEPVWINLDGETVQLVVNQITKDHVQGYLSEPKFKRPATSLAANDSK